MIKGSRSNQIGSLFRAAKKFEKRLSGGTARQALFYGISAALTDRTLWMCSAGEIECFEQLVEKFVCDLELLRR